MDDKADIRFVNTHTESDGGNDDIYLLHQEVVLCLGSECRVKTRMIRLCLDIIGTQYLRQFLYLFTRETVDDTALPRVLLDKLNDILVNILGLRTYLIIQVRTIERALELRRIHDTQILLDIRAHLVRCSRCQCDNRCIAYLIDNRTDTTIFRSEVMTPFRDTMSLIDSIEGNLRLFEELHILLLRQ